MTKVIAQTQEESDELDLTVVRTKIEMYCSRAEQCPSSVRRKLREWGVPAGDAETLVAGLVAEGFLDEQRFADAFVHDRLKFGKCGRNKIRFELRQKQISEQAASRAIATIDQQQYMDVLQAVADGKKQQLKGLATEQQRRRLTAYLLSKGFEMECITKVI